MYPSSCRPLGSLEEISQIAFEETSCLGIQAEKLDTHCRFDRNNSRRGNYAAAPRAVGDRASLIHFRTQQPLPGYQYPGSSVRAML